MPAFKSPKMTADMLAFNDIYRKAGRSAGGEFVDIWDGFVDENGAFVATGPDINGQPVRLRADDGINLTDGRQAQARLLRRKAAAQAARRHGSAGRRRLDRHGRRGRRCPAPADTGRIDRTAPMSLSDPELDGGARTARRRRSRRQARPRLAAARSCWSRRRRDRRQPAPADVA